MGTRVTELRCKEVINITDGQRLGFVSDVEVQLPEGKVLALVVPGPCRFFGLFGRKDDFVIPWNCIRQIGDDILAGRTPETEAKAPGSRNHNSRNTPAFAVKLHIHRAAQSTAGTDIDHFFLF